jgi:hypothetical protein
MANNRGKSKASPAFRIVRMGESASASPVASSLNLFPPTTLVGFAHSLAFKPSSKIQQVSS